MKRNKRKWILKTLGAMSFGIMFAIYPLVADDNKTDANTTKPFDMQDFYNKSIKSSPNDINVQDITSKMTSDNAKGVINSGNREMLTNDSIMKNEKLRGNKGVGDANEIMNLLDRSGTKADGNKTLITQTLNHFGVGDIASIEEEDISCYIVRIPTLFKYKCHLPGEAPPDIPVGNISFENAKKQCEKGCVKEAKCVQLFSKTDLMKKDSMIKIGGGTVIFDANHTKSQSFNISGDVLIKNGGLKPEYNFEIDGYKKTESISFDLNTTKPFYLDINYTYALNDNVIPLANNVLITNKENNETKREYFINMKIKNLDIKITPAEPLGEDDFIKIENFEVKIPASMRYGCPNQDVKAIDRGMYTSSDLRSFATEDGREFTIALGNIVGDNEDGSFSTKGGCESSCSEAGRCILERQTNTTKQSLLELHEGPLYKSSGTEKGITESICRKHRENNTPILNETIFDAEGNPTKTVINGIARTNVIRPRIMAGNTSNDEKFDMETKDLAFFDMITTSKYAESIPPTQERKNAYAYRKKGKELFINIKPGSDMYGKEAYAYTLITLETMADNYGFNYIEITNPSGQVVEKDDPSCYENKSNNSNSGGSNTFGGGADKENVCKETKKIRNFLSKYTFVLDENRKPQGIHKNIFHNNPTHSLAKNTFSKMEECNVHTKEGGIIKTYCWRDGGGFADTLAKHSEKFDDIEGNLLKREKYYLEYNALNDTGKALGQLSYGTVRNRVFSSIRLTEAGYGEESKNLSIKGTVLGEIYHNIQNLNQLDASFSSQNIRLDGKDIPFNYEIRIVLSDKQLSYKELYNKAMGDKNTLVYNYQEISDKLKPKLEDDNLYKNPFVSIYLVGTADSLTTFGTIKTAETDIGKKAYVFSWDKPLPKDSEKGSVVDLSPSNIQPLRIDESISDGIDPNTNTLATNIIFKQRDMSSLKNNGVYFGYSTAGFKESDCKLVGNGNNFEKVCLPWWKIERDYVNEKTYQAITTEEFRKTMSELIIPKEPKLVSACVSISKEAQWPLKEGGRRVTCSSYIDVAKGGLQVNTCSDKIKNNCSLFDTLKNWDKEMTGSYTKYDKEEAEMTNEKTIGSYRANTTTFIYDCPASLDVEPNKVCEVSQQVLMYPAQCGEQKENKRKQSGLNSGFIYCDTNRPIVENNAITGFRGTCPNTKTEVVCSTSAVATTTQRCLIPIIETKQVDKITTTKTKRTCEDVTLSTLGEGGDIYASNPSCFRINSNLDARQSEVRLKIVGIDGKNEYAGRGIVVSEVSGTGVKYFDGLCGHVDGQGKLPSECTSTVNWIQEYKRKNGLGANQAIAIPLRVKTDDGVDNTISIKDAASVIIVEQLSGFYKGGKTDIDGYDGHSLAPNYLEDIAKYGPAWTNRILDPNKGVGSLPGSDSFSSKAGPYSKISTKSRVFQGHTFAGDFPDNWVDQTNYKSSELFFQSDQNAIAVFPIVHTWNTKAQKMFCEYTQRYRNIFRGSTHSHGSGLKKLTNRYSGCHPYSGGGMDKHYRLQSDHSLKTLLNTTLGISILFPTASTYNIYFHDKNGDVIAKRTVDKGEMIGRGPGVLQNIRLNDNFKVLNLNKVKDEIDESKIEKYMITSGVNPYSIRTGGSTQTIYFNGQWLLQKRFDMSLTWGTWEEWGLRRFLFRNIVNDIMGTTNNHCVRYGSRGVCFARNDTSNNYSAFLELIRRLELSSNTNAPWLDIPGILRKAGGKVYYKYKGDYFEGSTNNPEAGIIDIYQDYFKPLDCANDDWSPTGGGALYHIHSASKRNNCPMIKSLDFIRKYSIYSITIEDTETNTSYNKKLIYPLAYPNRIYYTYLQSVENRRYRCCQDF